MALQTIRQNVVNDLPNTIENINKKIKTFDEPVGTFSELPLTGNDNGDIRIVLDENCMYIWSKSQNKWSKTYSNGSGYSKSLFFTINESNKTQINTGIRFDGMGEYQTSSTTINLYLNGILQNNNGLYTVEKINEELVVKWNFSSGENTLINGDTIAVEFFHINAAQDNNTYVTKREMDLKIQELLKRIEQLEQYNTGTLPEEIILETYIIELNVDDMVPLNYQIKPENSNKKVTFESSDDSIFVIRDNKIVALQPGEGILLIKTINNIYKQVVIKVKEINNNKFNTDEWYFEGCTVNYSNITNDSYDCEIIFTGASQYNQLSLKKEDNELQEYINKTLIISHGITTNDDVEIKITIYKNGQRIINDQLESNQSFEILVDDLTDSIKVDYRTTSSYIGGQKTINIQNCSIKTKSNKIYDIVPEEAFGTTTENFNYDYSNIKSRENLIKKIKNKNCICFLQFSDTHLTSGESEDLHNVNAVVTASKILPLDAIISGGDFKDNGVEHSIYEAQANTYTNILSNCNSSVYYAKGNHCTNRKYGSNVENPHDLTVSNQKYFDLFSSKSFDKDNDVIHFDDDISVRNRGYFYVDKPNLKHRFIILNTHEIRQYTDDDSDIVFEKPVSDGVRSDHQMAWLIKKALNMEGKNDWTVSIHCHMVMECGDWNNNYGDQRSYMNNLLKDFKYGLKGSMIAEGDIRKNHEWNFISQGPIKLLGVFGGHVHSDCYTNVNGVDYFVNTSNDNIERIYWDGNDNPTVPAPKREDIGFNSLSQNVYIFDKESNDMYIIKLGSGEDKVINIKF